ncbi:MAG: GNAT family N-acetyltransferase [Bacteroides sp.]
MKVTTAKTVNNQLVEALQRLIPQLTPNGEPITSQTLEELVYDKNSELLLAIDDLGQIVGTLALIVFRIPTGKKAFIEDVVVDESARGKGLGEKLLVKAIELAKLKGVQRIELSSRPMRVPANKLYQKLGFKQRETNYYRLQL